MTDLKWRLVIGEGRLDPATINQLAAGASSDGPFLRQEITI